MGTARISDQVGTNPSITSEWPCAHIWSCKTTSYSRIRKALSPRPSIPGNWLGTSILRMATALIFDHVGTNPIVISEWLSSQIWDERNQSSHHDIIATTLIFDHVGINPIVISEWISTHILHGRNQSSHHDRMAQPLHLTMEGTNPLTMSKWL